MEEENLSNVVVKGEEDDNTKNNNSNVQKCSFWREEI
jgi:hypothetical protein